MIPSIRPGRRAAVALLALIVDAAVAQVVLPDLPPAPPTLPASSVEAAPAPVIATPPPPAPVPAPPPAPVFTNRLDEILARGTLRVGTTGDYKPFSYRVGTSDTFVGLDIALAADLAKSLGVTMQIVPTTWGGMMGDLGADKFDVAIGGVSVSLERQKKAFFSIPMLRDGKTPIVRCADVAKYQTLADIDNPDVRLIVNPGGTNERFDRANAPHAMLIMHPDNVTIFDRLAAGGARGPDVMITDAIETRLQQGLHPGVLCAVHPEAPFDFSEKAVLLPRDIVLKAYVDQWLHQAIETGAFAKLNAQWLAYPWGMEPLRQAIDARLLLSVDVAKYKWNMKAPIEDLAREAQVISTLGSQAAALGVPQPWAENFFRAQIQASKTVQDALLRSWSGSNQGPFPDAPDLVTVTRPKLDQLTDQMLKALAANWPLLSNPARHDDIMRTLRPMAAERLNPQAVSEAISPLSSN